MAEGGALLRRYVGELLRRGFESLLLRLRARIRDRVDRPLRKPRRRLRRGQQRRSGRHREQALAAHVCDRPDDSGRCRPQRGVHERQRLRYCRLQHVPGAVHARRRLAGDRRAFGNADRVSAAGRRVRTRLSRCARRGRDVGARRRGARALRRRRQRAAALRGGIDRRQLDGYRSQHRRRDRQPDHRHGADRRIRRGRIALRLGGLQHLHDVVHSGYGRHRDRARGSNEEVLLRARGDHGAGERLSRGSRCRDAVRVQRSRRWSSPTATTGGS